MRSLRQFLAITRLTATEALRQPLSILLTAACVAAAGLVPLLILHDFAEEGKLARDAGLAMHLVLGLFLTIYVACTALSRDTRNDGLSLILSKPVSREVLFLAKFTGVAAVILLFSFCSTVACLLTERVAEKFVMVGTSAAYVTDIRTGTFLAASPFVAIAIAGLIDYFTRYSFESAAFGLILVCLLTVFLVCGFFDRTGHMASLDFRVQWRIIPVASLIAIALVLLASIAMALSTRLPAVSTFAVCIALFLVGLTSDYLLGRYAADVHLAALAYRIIPNWQHLWVPDALLRNGHVPRAYIANALLYATTYSAGALCLGMYSFRRVETN